MRWLKKGLPAVKNFGEAPKDLEFDNFDMPDMEAKDPEAKTAPDGEKQTPEEDEEGVQRGPQQPLKKVLPPQQDEYQWLWKVSL